MINLHYRIIKMTAAAVTNTKKLTTAPRKPDDTVDKLDLKQLVGAYSENESLCWKYMINILLFYTRRIFTPC